MNAALSAVHFYSMRSNPMNSRLDSSSYEAIIGLLCRSGRLSDAYSMVERFTHDCNVGNTAQVENDNFDGGRGGGGGDHGGPPENAAIYLSLARAWRMQQVEDYLAARTTLKLSFLTLYNLTRKSFLKSKSQILIVAEVAIYQYFIYLFYQTFLIGLSSNIMRILF